MQLRMVVHNIRDGFEEYERDAVGFADRGDSSGLHLLDRSPESDEVLHVLGRAVQGISARYRAGFQSKSRSDIRLMQHRAMAFPESDKATWEIDSTVVKNHGIASEVDIPDGTSPRVKATRCTGIDEQLGPELQDHGLAQESRMQGTDGIDVVPGVHSRHRHEYRVFQASESTVKFKTVRIWSSRSDGRELTRLHQGGGLATHRKLNHRVY